jgi:hypothetical protein
VGEHKRNFGIAHARIAVQNASRGASIATGHRFKYGGVYIMRRTAIMLAGFVILLTLGASAQEDRSEISLEGTGFFTRDTSSQGVSRTTSDTGGFLLGYRYHINRWIAAEGDYGFDRNTQKYFASLGESRVQANVHAVTGDVVATFRCRSERSVRTRSLEAAV